jgi:hypothetical protein
MMTDSEWIDHWVSAAPVLSSEVLEVIQATVEDDEEEDLRAA